MPPSGHELLLTDVERRIALRELVGIGSVGPDAIAALSALSQRTSYAAGTVLLHADEQRTRVHIVVSGDLRVVRAGEARTFSEDHEEMDLLWIARDSVPVDVDTQGGVEVLEFPVVGLEELLQEHFSIWMAMTRNLSTKLLVRQQRAVDLTRADAAASPLADRLMALQQGLPFAQQHVDALIQLEEAGTELMLEPHAAPWPRDEPVSSLLVPLVGTITATASDQIAGVGGMDLLAGLARRTNVAVSQPVPVLRIPQETFIDVLEDQPALARDLLASIAAALIGDTGATGVDAYE